MQISDNPAQFADEGRSDLAYAARYRGGCSCKVRRQDIVLSTELTNSRDRDPLQRADEVPGFAGRTLAELADANARAQKAQDAAEPLRRAGTTGGRRGGETAPSVRHLLLTMSVQE